MTAVTNRKSPQGWTSKSTRNQTRARSMNPAKTTSQSKPALLDTYSGIAGVAIACLNRDFWPREELDKKIEYSQNCQRRR